MTAISGSFHARIPEHDATLRRHPHHRHHPCAGRPFAAYQLAVLGADVIKVEHPDEPDQSREGGTDRALNRRNMGTSFLTQGSNKRSITLDLKHRGGPRNPEEARRPRRRAGRELPARRLRGAGRSATRRC